jgi:hypothetical protein
VAILVERCTECHDDLARSGLDVTSRALVLKGGSKGPAVVPGNPEASLLFRMVSGKQEPKMPPGKETLTAVEIETLRAWIAGGVPWPHAVAAASKPAEPRWWSFRKPERPALPSVSDAWVRTPIDAFILRKLRHEKLAPAPEADRVTLIRRATFDLHGLPATANEVRAFVDDSAPGAYEKVIDRLLASPRFGEKWGRHWLDLVRYGDTSGYEQDPYLLDAWRYRDWVIAAFNADKPYDRFIKEQLAGDELYPDDPEARAGTGYFTVGPNRDMLFMVEDINRVETLTDYVDTTSSVFLGLSLGCARCHDHKFDPLLQKDYYRLQAIFAPMVKSRVFLHYNAVRAWDVEDNYRQFKLREIGSELSALLEPYRKKLRDKKKAGLPSEMRAALAVDEGKRKPAEKVLASAAGKKMSVKDAELRASLSAGDRQRLVAIEHSLVSMFTGYAPAPQAPAVSDPGVEAPPTFMPVRGKDGPGEEIWPGFPEVLGGYDIPGPPRDGTSTGRRKALAEWLSRADHPLTARVMVNRLWNFHFGRGLVATPSEFGRKGLPPTHPQLLDWLAAELPARGWSLKAMHRLMMTSSVYRQDSAAGAEARQRDPENLWLSHFNRRRLTAEEIRDGVLATAGTINYEMGGRPVVPPLPPEELFGLSVPVDKAWVVSTDKTKHTRRSVYLLQRRGFRQPIMEAFDTPEGILTCPLRDSSTASPQALTLLNGDFTTGQARVFAGRLLTSLKKGGDVVDVAWQDIFGRTPTAEERSMANKFFERQRGRLGDKAAVSELARALWNSNLFLYVD